MRIGLIGGVFDADGGRRSGYVERLGNALTAKLGTLPLYKNGGHWSSLTPLVQTLGDLDAVLWFADVPNDLPKIVVGIKAEWPKLYLVTSKRNLGAEYPWSEILGRALKAKANLTVVMTGERSNVASTVIDPLGSAFCVEETDIAKVADVLVRRLTRLRGFKRIGSRQVGERIPAPGATGSEFSDTLDLSAFYEIIRAQAERFHAIIHGVGHERMMGNASFRCAKGFPSFKEGSFIFVSQRDVDKRHIGPDAFVAVAFDPAIRPEAPVHYYGPVKPSVDTPIQVRLYAMFPNVRYMLHSHTYIQGAPMTPEPIPCGAIEEAEAVFALIGDHEAADFAVNLKGHGSLVLASKLDTMREQPWIPRHVPERAV